ncbi:MAG: hypothetical protein HKO96_01800 [Flavobacteriaceae bacterium]|nr:hypothetical protein [Flavobacteriaceae bacterium]
MDKIKASTTFRKKGTCSQTFTHILNREMGNLNESVERAADPLAGGILQKGHQCGMIWGSALALGMEAFRKFKNPSQAKYLAISGTQKLVSSFKATNNNINCRDITSCDFSSKWSFLKYMISGRFLQCFKMADRWAPEALRVAEEGLNGELNNENSNNCASEVIAKMDGTEEEQVMVAGFAGGLGLSGEGCGALSTVIWKKALDWSKENPEKSTFYNPESGQVLNRFLKFTEGEMICRNICRRQFESASEHSEYIEGGGCHDLMTQLTNPEQLPL